MRSAVQKQEYERSGLKPEIRSHPKKVDAIDFGKHPLVKLLNLAYLVD